MCTLYTMRRPQSEIGGSVRALRYRMALLHHPHWGRPPNSSGCVAEETTKSALIVSRGRSTVAHVVNLSSNSTF